MFERYVNFEFYKRLTDFLFSFRLFERYVNFEFYKRRATTTNEGTV